METLSQLGGGLWEHNHLNYYVSRDGGIGISKVNDEAGKLGKWEQLLSGFPCVLTLLSLCVFLDLCFSLW